MIRLLLISLLLVGCDAHQFKTGDCIYIKARGAESIGVVKAEYLRYADGAHWFLVDGEVRALHKYRVHITHCEEINSDD
jgi:hypothetical protein